MEMYWQNMKRLNVKQCLYLVMQIVISYILLSRFRSFEIICMIVKVSIRKLCSTKSVSIQSAQVVCKLVKVMIACRVLVGGLRYYEAYNGSNDYHRQKVGLSFQQSWQERYQIDRPCKPLITRSTDDYLAGPK